MALVNETERSEILLTIGYGDKEVLMKMNIFNYSHPDREPISKSTSGAFHVKDWHKSDRRLNVSNKENSLAVMMDIVKRSYDIYSGNRFDILFK